MSREYFWELTSRCWSVRKRVDAGVGWGTGVWVCEDDWPPPDPPPVTTIAWRLAHLSVWTEVYRDRTFGAARLGLPQLDPGGSAGAAVDWLIRAQESFTAEVAEIDDVRLSELRPAHYGPELPIGKLVWMIIQEHIHHGAEIRLLGDLKRGHARKDPDT